MRVLVLGAGQDVGRSCVVAYLGGKAVMFDCGMHMAYNDERRFPDFTLITQGRPYHDVIDMVVITHFHLDHCGALPYFTEVCGYSGPIYMTFPTKAIAPIMLEDYYKVLSEGSAAGGPLFARHHIRDCMKKVTPVQLHEAVTTPGGIHMRVFYAGHVLGAVMVQVTVGQETVLYTGDYNMTPNRHLGAACLPPGLPAPDLLITESTYATTIRESKRAREREFLTLVHDAVARGGKVLIPMFAVGRAQELLVLLDEYWERMKLEVPIYFSSKMVEQANMFYELMVNWTNERVRGSEETFRMRRMQVWDPSLTHQPGPCVLFATPGMLNGGVSLKVFKAWASEPKNCVLLSTLQAGGTLGRQLLQQQTRRIQLDSSTSLEVKCQVRCLSFSAHTDVKGILSLIQRCHPRHVMLVHGELSSMEFLKNKVASAFGIPCHTPPNGAIVFIPPPRQTQLQVSRQLIQRCLLAVPTEQSDRYQSALERLKEVASLAAGQGPLPCGQVQSMPAQHDGGQGKCGSPQGAQEQPGIRPDGSGREGSGDEAPGQKQDHNLAAACLEGGVVDHHATPMPVDLSSCFQPSASTEGPSSSAESLEEGEVPTLGTEIGDQQGVREQDWNLPPRTIEGVVAGVLVREGTDSSASEQLTSWEEASAQLGMNLHKARIKIETVGPDAV